MFAGAWLSQFDAIQYVEPAVNRQPGFRRELVEQNHHRDTVMDKAPSGFIKFKI